jgi:hypothetical protein
MPHALMPTKRSAGSGFRGGALCFFGGGFFGGVSAGTDLADAAVLSKTQKSCR